MSLQLNCQPVAVTTRERSSKNNGRGTNTVARTSGGARWARSSVELLAPVLALAAVRWASGPTFSGYGSRPFSDRKPCCNPDRFGSASDVSDHAEVIFPHRCRQYPHKHPRTRRTGKHEHSNRRTSEVPTDGSTEEARYQCSGKAAPRLLSRQYEQPQRDGRAVRIALTGCSSGSLCGGEIDSEDAILKLNQR